MSASDIDLILYRLGEMDKKIDEVRSEQKAIASRGTCPNPGACIILQRDVETMQGERSAIDDRLRSLESVRDEARGVGLAAKAVWAFVGAGGIGVMFAILKAAKLV
jgi:hypothetical protein